MTDDYTRTDCNDKIKVGDIFYNSWGYDQTNIDYYQVTRKTKKRIFVRKLKSEVIEDGFMQGNSMPIKDNFRGEEIQKAPFTYLGECCLKGGIYIPSPSGYGSCELWDGKAKRCSWYA